VVRSSGQSSQMPPKLLHASSVIGTPLFDSSGDRLGRVTDLVARLGEAQTHPPITGLVARTGRREFFVPMHLVAALEPGKVRLAGEKLNLSRFERRAGELLLKRDLLGRHVINVVGARLIRANEIELGQENGQWEIVGVDPTRRALLRRLLRRRGNDQPTQLIDWSQIEPFFGHVPSARLRIRYRKLARLHPARLADLVEAASHEEGEEIIEALGENSELEADVFEELDADHQVEFIESRSDDEAARLLSSMAPDDAADLIAEIDQDRRKALLEAMPTEQQTKVRSLLSYNPETAGGLMSPDFVCLPAEVTARDAIEVVRASKIAPEALGVVFCCDEDRQLRGMTPLAKLIQADPDARLGEICHPDPPTLQARADLHEVMRTMADFNLTVAPVVDDDGRAIGVVTVDDLLEAVLPTGWRRDAAPSVPAD
jgi:sporulation protein YlmC with PRC-barrel domain